MNEYIELLVEDDVSRSKKPTSKPDCWQRHFAPFPRKVCYIFFGWILFVIIATAIGYQRVGRTYLQKYSLTEMMLNGIAKRLSYFNLCGVPDNMSEICGSMLTVQELMQARPVYIYEPSSGQCVMQDVEMCSMMFSRFFHNAEDCLRECQWDMAPTGAYLLMSGLLATVLLFVGFIFCLPLERDKTVLQRRLLRWLIVNFFLMIIVAGMTQIGAILVITHDTSSDVANRPYKLFFDMLLLIMPSMVLIIHVYFWLFVRTVYKRIDPSKEVLRGVWSSKM